MERDILQLLQNSSGQFFNAKEVGKKVDRKQFAENPNWARPILFRLVERGQIAQRADGFFYYPKGSSK